MKRHYLVAIFAALTLAACATTPSDHPLVPPLTPPLQEVPDNQTGSDQPALGQTDPAPPGVTAPAPTPDLGDIDDVYKETPPPVMIPPDPRSPMQSLPFWNNSDPRPALAAFKRSCGVWAKKKPTDRISSSLAIYGRWADWHRACTSAQFVPDLWLAAQQFFEREFLPVDLFATEPQPGLLTGYYQPEMEVRRHPDAVFSDPILALPIRKQDRKLPRSSYSAQSARVIAYGRPIDVFFLHIQGSGHITFEDGHRIRAAYAGNNGYPYTSIGKVLVERGEMTLSQASKQAIEAWMAQNGPVAARALMNENKRFIFFSEDLIQPGEGPKGAMQVPLTAMGSMAVDPRYHPYGTPVWLTTTLPTVPGDYRGQPAGLLVIAQDTGKAIKGPMRGDLYFGSGPDAGGRAGVMKHPARWTVLLPTNLALRYVERS